MSQKPPSGTGTLNGQPVTTPITVPTGTNTLLDNETDASITVAAGGDNQIDEWGSDATIALQDGSDHLEIEANGATITGGNGYQDDVFDGQSSITFGVGTDHGQNSSTLLFNDGNNTVTVGDGDWEIGLAGKNNTFIGGDGNQSVVSAPENPHLVTNDTVMLGNGTNSVEFLGGVGNTVWDGSGTDAIAAHSGGTDFVINAAGGTQNIEDFTLTNGDMINLSQFLPHATERNLAHWISLSTEVSKYGKTGTVLTITNPHGATDTMTLYGSGALTLSDLRPSIIL